MAEQNIVNYASRYNMWMCLVFNSHSLQEIRTTAARKQSLGLYPHGGTGLVGFSSAYTLQWKDV